MTQDTDAGEINETTSHKYLEVSYKQWTKPLIKICEQAFIEMKLLTVVAKNIFFLWILQETAAVHYSDL